MSRKSSGRKPTPLRVWRTGNGNGNDVEEQLDHKEKGMQIVSLSESPPFSLPHDWLVEERPRPSNPSHVDKYYYEPGTGRQFRSLLSVERYLTQDTSDFCTTERMISEDENTTYNEPGTGQRFRSLRAVERYLNGESVPTATSKLVAKSDNGKQSAPGVKSCLEAVKKRSSIAEEENITLKALKHSIQSTDPKKSDLLQKQINSQKDRRASVHNLSGPPSKVTWVLSGPGGFWSPLLDGSIVTESQKLKWSEAFVLSIRDGLNS